MSTKFFRRVITTATIVLLGQFAIAPAAKAQTITAHPQARILQQIDNKATTTFAKSTPAAITRATDQGRLDPNTPLEHMVLTLKSTDAQETALRTLVDQQHDKGTASFHKWITPDEFGASFGVADSDIQKINTWLQSQGFSIDSVAKGKRLISFSGTSGQVENAFHTSMHRYAVNGEQHISNSTDLSIPKALQAVVKSAPSLNDFMSQPAIGPKMHLRSGSDGLFHADPNYPNANFGGGVHGVAPGDFAKIYNTAASGADGTGVTIGIVGRSAILLSDVQVFRRLFNLPDNDPEITSAGPAPGHTEAEFEADLDVEEAGAIAPMAKIVYAPGASSFNFDGIGLSAIAFVENNAVDIINISFGNCEANTGSGFWDTLWEQAAAQGQSVFVSSGDNGAFGCDPQFNGGTALQGLAVSGIASTPFNTAVGGTMFAEGTGNFWSTSNGPGLVSALGYIPEAGWDEGQINTGDPVLAASGGGISTLFSRPSWQTGSGISNAADPRDVGQGAGLHRLVPDVAFNSAGHDFTLLCSGGDCTIDSQGHFFVDGAEGTSIASPAMAGIQALIDQKNGGRQGLGNYFYYKLANTDFTNSKISCNSTGATLPNAACNFNDVTTGSNREFIPGPAGTNDGFDAGAGYDLVTGLGSMNVTNMVNNWSSVTFLSTTTAFTINPVTAVHGTTVNFTATVAPGSGTGKPTGDVTLVLTPSSEGGPAGPFFDQNFNLFFGGNTFPVAADGTVTGSVNGLPGGTYTIAARYGGDGVFGSSTSTPVSVTITPEGSITQDFAGYFDHTGNINTTPPFSVGQTIFIETQVTSKSGNGTATGTVTFTDNGKTIATLPLNPSGEISLVAGPPPADFANQFPQSAPTFAVGAHKLVATYSGDSGLTGSAAPEIDFNVTPATQGINLTASAASISSGASVTFTATIPNVTVDGVTIAANATGTVTFFDGATSLGSAALVNNVATLSTKALITNGPHSITAQYAGDANYAAATSNPTTVTVGVGVSAPVTLAISNPTPVVNQTVTYTVTVGTVAPNAAPTGTVSLFSDGVLFATGTLDATGTVVIKSNVPAAGVHAIVATYSGDAVYTSTSSTPSTLTVAKSPTALNLTSKTTGVFGGQIALIASFSSPTFPPQPNAPTASVTFLDGTTVLGTAPLVFSSSGNLIATFTTNMLGGGTHNLTATFAGDANFTASTSNVDTVTITPAPTDTTLTLSAQTAVQGANVTLTATVTGAIPGLPPPTGTVSFFDGTTLLGTSPLNGTGVATLTTSFLTNGPHVLTAVYSGDANYAGSSSTASDMTTVTVTPAFTLFANPSSLTINRGDNGFVAIGVTSDPSFSGVITFTCENLPTNAACEFFPATTSVSNGSSTTVELVLKGHVPANPLSASALHNGGATDGGMLPAIPALAFWLPGAALSGFGLGRKRTARQRHMVLLAVFALGLVGMVGLTGCGTGNGVEAAKGTYNISVVGTSGNIVNSVPLTLTIK